MKEITSHIEIHSPASRVWAILTDFADFSRWNPFIIRIDGYAQVGARLDVKIQPPGSKPMTFRPLVLKAEPGRELRWLGRLVLPGVFDGEHVFSIEPLAADQVLFRQSEQFRGLLVPILWSKISENTRRGYESMNEAIKRVAEAD